MFAVVYMSEDKDQIKETVVRQRMGAKVNKDSEGIVNWR